MVIPMSGPAPPTHRQVLDTNEKPGLLARSGLWKH
jgi:hypothetical protein